MRHSVTGVKYNSQRDSTRTPSRRYKYCRCTFSRLHVMKHAICFCLNMTWMLLQTVGLLWCTVCCLPCGCTKVNCGLHPLVQAPPFTQSFQRCIMFLFVHPQMVVGPKRDVHNRYGEQQYNQYSTYSTGDRVTIMGLFVQRCIVVRCFFKNRPRQHEDVLVWAGG